MVYESGFTSRRTYTSRPVVTSYAVSYPTVTRISRVFKTSYPIYSTSSYTRGTRVISSPVRIVTSPSRVVTRVIRSPSPVRISSYNLRTPTYTSYIPSTYYSSYTPYVSSYIPRYTSSYVPSTYVYSSPTYLHSTPLTRIYSRSLSPVRVLTSPVRATPSYLKRTLPGYGARALTNYCNTEPFTTFREETDRIRHRAQSLMTDLHTPVIRRARSMTPFPVCHYEPTTDVALDAYIRRITNPVRHIAKEVHRMSMYPEPAHKYVGKSHLASIRICGDKAYNVRRPYYDNDRVRTDINLLSWYLRHPNVKEEKTIEKKVASAESDPELDPYRPSRKFSSPRPLEDSDEDDIKEKQALRQKRLMTVNEEVLDLVELEKKRAQRADELKLHEQKPLKEEKSTDRKVKKGAAGDSEESARLDLEEKQRQEQELKRLAKIKEEEELAAQEAEKKALEEEKKLKEAEEARKRLEDEARLAEEAKIAEEAANKAAEAARLAEEQRIREEEEKALEEEKKQKEAEEARQRLEKEAKLVEEARLAEEAKIAEEAARLAEEQRVREEEINRLIAIEKQAEEDREAEVARQAAELAEIARQESEVAAQELQSIQQSKTDANATEELITNELANDEIQEPAIDLCINNGDADIVPTTEEEEETEEE